MSDAVIIEIKQGVADVRINRPEKRNAVDGDVMNGLLGALANIARLDRIKELLFTGRRFTGEEAYEYGLATVLSETPRETALKMARTIADRNPDAIRAAKKLVNTAAMAAAREGLVAESNCSRTLMGTANQLEAIMSSMEAREPAFTDPS